MFHYVSVKDGKKRIFWSALLAFVATAYALVIAAAEAFWYFFTGGFSQLIGGFALVAATLLVIRVVGASLATAAFAMNSGLDSTGRASNHSAGLFSAGVPD